LKVAHRDEAADVAESLPEEVTIALGDVAGAIREGLTVFCCRAGLLAVSEIMNKEMTAKAGSKGRHDPLLVSTRNGSAPGSVALGRGWRRCAGPERRWRLVGVPGKR
jgi:hypothetical protein